MGLDQVLKDWWRNIEGAMRAGSNETPFEELQRKQRQDQESLEEQRAEKARKEKESKVEEGDTPAEAVREPVFAPKSAADQTPDQAPEEPTPEPTPTEPDPAMEDLKARNPEAVEAIQKVIDERKELQELSKTVTENVGALKDGNNRNDDGAFNKIAGEDAIKDSQVIKTDDANSIAAQGAKLAEMLKNGASPEDLRVQGNTLRETISSAQTNAVDVGSLAANEVGQVPSQAAAIR